MNVNEALQLALEQARPQLEAGLAEAEEELRELEERREQLVELIGQAKAALGLASGAPASRRALTLHEAIAQLLRERGNEWTSAREIADEVNRRALYYKRDGSPVELNQIHARTKNYTHLFEKQGSKVRLRSE